MHHDGYGWKLFELDIAILLHILLLPPTRHLFCNGGYCQSPSRRLHLFCNGGYCQSPSRRLDYARVVPVIWLSAKSPAPGVHENSSSVKLSLCNWKQLGASFMVQPDMLLDKLA